MRTPRILIADDEPSLRKVLSASLSREGSDVISAEDGKKAIAILEDAERLETGVPIDLVVAVRPDDAASRVVPAEPRAGDKSEAGDRVRFARRICRLAFGVRVPKDCGTDRGAGDRVADYDLRPCGCKASRLR